MKKYQALAVTNKRHWQDFYNLPKYLHQNDEKQAIELTILTKDELNPKKNPIARECELQAFVVYKQHQIVGRCVAIINPKLNLKMDKRIGQIGYIEFIDDTSALNELITITSDWLNAHDCEYIWSDLRFSLNYQVGLQTQGHQHKQTFLMPRQPKYYTERLSDIGFHCIKSLNAYQIKLDKHYAIPTSIKEQAKNLIEDGYSIRQMNKKDVWTCLNDYNQRWEGNFAHTPFTQSELDHLNSAMGLFLDKRFCFVVEKDHELAGYLFTFPDYNQSLSHWNGSLGIKNILSFLWRYKLTKNVNALKTAIIGVTHAHTGKKLTSLLNFTLLEKAIKLNCQTIERSWILEDNLPSIKQAERMGGTLYKQYGIYEASLKDFISHDIKEAS